VDVPRDASSGRQSRDLTFSVVIATLARPDRLELALADLAALDPLPLEVLIVDGDQAGSSATQVAAAATAMQCPVRYLIGPRGLTRQRNRGIAAARGDVVVFLDDDSRPSADLLRILAEVYRDSDVVGATGRVIEPSSHSVGGQTSMLRLLIPGGGAQGQFTRCGYPRRLLDLGTARDVEFMQGCLMSARASAAKAVGFDESLPGYALAEDEDFSYRLSRRGRIRFDPRAVVHHDNAGFGARDRHKFNRTVVLHRAYLFRKNFPQTRRARAEFGMLLAVLAAHRMINRDFDGLGGLVSGVAEMLRRR
jgi:GT2 family glycosyltransferase